MKIEIITSPNAKLKETGFGSSLACTDVLASIEKIGHAAILTVCESQDDLDNVVKRKPDLVVLAAKYITLENGNKVWFSEYFARNKITFSGSSRETLKFDSDKVLAKVHLASIGIKTAKHFTAIPGQYEFEEKLPLSFPLFLKPIDAANGNGIDDMSFVENFVEFESKVSSLYGIYNQPVLVEEFLGGREFTVAIIKSGSGKMTVSAIELVPPVSSGRLRILGASVKRLDTETLKEIESNDIDCVREVAMASFQGLGARGFGRIDVKMDNQGLCYFLEANLVPGMNHGTSYFPRACEIANDMSYDEVIQLMLDECLNRVITEREFNKMLKQNAASCAV
jgi:D-alanine-D-alanine ligase